MRSCVESLKMRFLCLFLFSSMLLQAQTSVLTLEHLPQPCTSLSSSLLHSCSPSTALLFSQRNKKNHCQQLASAIAQLLIKPERDAAAVHALLTATALLLL